MAIQALQSYSNPGELGARLEALMPQWQQRTDTELSEAAANKYTPIYNAQVEGAQQQQQSSDMALAQQIERLLPAYQRQVEDINTATAQGVSVQNRQALSRGMQRSSFNNATLANISNTGTKQVALAGEQYSMNVAQINDQRAQLEMQLAQTINRLETDKAMNIAGYTDEMRQQDWQNAMSGYQALQDLYLELSRLQYQHDQAAAEQARWEAEFNRSKSSGKSGGSKAAASSTASATSSAATQSEAQIGSIKLPGTSSFG